MRAHLRTVIVLALSVGMLAWFLRGANLREVWTEIQDGRLGLLALALGVTGMTYVFRALRWQYLLRPLGHPSFSLVFKATVIGFAASTLLPARAGEVVRPYLLARRAGFSAMSAFATIILERVLDLMTVLLLFGCYLALSTPAVVVEQSATFTALKSGGLLAGIASVVGLILLMVVAGHPEKLAAWALRVERVLPSKVANAMAHFVRTFLEGLAVVRQPGRLAVAGLLSLPLWLSIALGIWLTSRAFHIDMSYPGAFLMMAVLVVGVAVPTPGAVGGLPQGLPDRRRGVLRGRQRQGGGRRAGAARDLVPAGHHRRGGVPRPGRLEPQRCPPALGPGRPGGRGMKCPYCGHMGDKVVDSRESKEGDVIRRRRECLECSRRFTSYERVDDIPYMVIKKDGRRERFERQKLIAGMLRACEKRPVTVSALEAIADRIEGILQDRPEKEIATGEIGVIVMQDLKRLDKVAYVRFASVYRDFRDIGEFMVELKDLINAKE